MKSPPTARAFLTCVLIGTACQPAFAAEPVAATVVRFDGVRAAGSVAGFDGKTIRMTQAGTNVNEPVASTLCVEFATPERPPMREPVLEFANGDRIHAEVVVTAADALEVRWHGDNLSVPLEMLRGVLFRPLDPNDGSSELLLRDKGPHDLVLLTNGDRLAGQFIALSATDLKIDIEGREVLAPRERVAAILFSPELTIAPHVPVPRQIVYDASGWITVAGLAASKDEVWSGTTAFGERAAWPVTELHKVEFIGEPVVPLSSIDPAKVDFTPYLDRVWPVRKNRSVTGEPLEVGQMPSAIGLGVHSRCRLEYDLAGAFDAFHAVAGLATSAGEVGNVDFVIELDGREALRTGAMSRSSEPHQINLDVRGVKTLALTVDFGRNGDVLDRANWCDAVLIRKLSQAQ